MALPIFFCGGFMFFVHETMASLFVAFMKLFMLGKLKLLVSGKK